MAKKFFIFTFLLLAVCPSLSAQTSSQSLCTRVLGIWSISEEDEDSKITTTYHLRADSTATLKFLIESDAIDGAFRVTVSMDWELNDSTVCISNIDWDKLSVVYFGDNLELRKNINDNSEVGKLLGIRLLANCPYINDYMKINSITDEELTICSSSASDEEDETSSDEADAPEAEADAEEADEPTTYTFRRVQP